MIYFQAVKNSSYINLLYVAFISTKYPEKLLLKSPKFFREMAKHRKISSVFINIVSSHAAAKNIRVLNKRSVFPRKSGMRMFFL